ncbi:MAG: damage-inducible protein DinB [Cytophagaceae bacterium]|nr:damage-inducible protein DinB [Gemmatimonadaceae bacterium]
MSESTTVDILRALFAHAAWGNRAVLEGLRTSPGSDAASIEQFAHVLAAESVWLTRLRGVPQAIAVWPSLTLDECGALLEGNVAGFAEYLDGGATALEREVTYTNSAGRTFTDRASNILLHVALHGSYHRGMVSSLTRRSGGAPAPTDFIAYVRGAPTATRADAERAVR